MNRKTLVISALVILLAIGSFGLYLFINKQDENKVDPLEIFSFDRESVYRVDINCADGEFIAECIDGYWYMQNIEGFNISGDYYINLIYYMSELTATKIYGTANTAEEKAVYYLDEPITVTCYDEQNTYKIYVSSKPSPTYDVYYFMKEGSNNVYGVPSDRGSVLQASRAMIESVFMTRINESDIVKYTLIKDGKEAYTFERNPNNQFKVVGKYDGLQTNFPRTNTTIAMLTRQRRQGLLETKLTDMTKYGFDKPVAEVIISGEGGKTQHLLFSYYGDASTYTHVLDVETGLVGLFYTYDLDFIEDDVMRYLVDRVHNLDISKVSKIDINYHGEEISYDVDKEKGEYSLNGSRIDKLGKSAEEAIDGFLTGLEYLVYSSVDVDAVPSGDPDISIRITSNDSDDVYTLEFIPKDELNYYMLQNGEYAGRIVQEKNISNSPSFMYWHERIQRIINGEQ